MLFKQLIAILRLTLTVGQLPLQIRIHTHTAPEHTHTHTRTWHKQTRQKKPSILGKSLEAAEQ